LKDNGILVLVAVRLKSTRYPKKALADLCGKPLILRLFERISQAVLPDGIVLCTSTHEQDDPIQVLAEQHGISVYRGSENDVIARFLDVARSREAKTVIRVTGDNPLTDPEMMDIMVKEHTDKGVEYTYTEDLPRGTRCEVIDVAALERCHQLVQDPQASEYMTLMLRRSDHFRILKIDARDPSLVRPEIRLTVDTAEDYDVVSTIYEAFNGEPPELDAIIRWLDEQPELCSRNQHIKPRELDESINVKLVGD